MSLPVLRSNHTQTSLACSPAWRTFPGTLVLLACFIGGTLATLKFVSAEPAQLSHRPPWTTSRVKGAPKSPSPFRVEDAFPGMQWTNPTSLNEVPGESTLLVTEMGGKIYSFPKEAGVEEANLVADLAQHLKEPWTNKEVGILDLTLHPQFAQNRFIFICYVHPADESHVRVSRFKLTTDQPLQLVPNSEQAVITWPANAHNGGCIRFGKDGHLYISTGDNWGPNPPDFRNNGQDITNLFGAVLRIDVNNPTDGKAYSIPSDNPFINQQGARPEIWTYGLRNPWRFAIDRITGDLFIADNGWETWESVHHPVSGSNCGWPIMEGRAILRSEVTRGPTPIRPPAKDHPHTEANSVIGGVVYRGELLEELHGWFIYGDYITGTIWALRESETGGYDGRTLVDTDLRIVAFAEGSAGELFVLDYDLTGKIHRLLPSDVEDSSGNFPRRLSETGLFRSLEPLKPAAGVVPYSVRVGRWVDGARARRWVAIPEEATIGLSETVQTGSRFPENTVFVKHLDWPAALGQAARPLETQLLHFSNGLWNPYTYQWDEAGQDAILVDTIGATSTVHLPEENTGPEFSERTWHFGAENECRLCHNAGSGYVLGFVPHQLNRPVVIDNNTQLGQLAALAGQNVLDSHISIAPNDPLRLVNPHDESQSLEDRARSYLHVNCSSCHHPRGNAIVNFYLRRDLPVDKLNASKGTIIGTFGIDGANVLVPGDPYQSLIVYRMAKLGFARMPYIGSQAVDRKAVALVAKWIASLPSESDQQRSAPATPGTPQYEALQTLDRHGLERPEARRQAIEQLLTTTPGALALLTKMHDGQLHTTHHELAAQLGSQDPRANVAGLFETFVPESQRLNRLGQTIDPHDILSLEGNALRGQLIFYSDGARCRHCHQVDDPQQSLGPTLIEINKKYPRREEFLQHLLDPSLKIEKPYVTQIVLTTDGRLTTGMLESESPTEIVLRTAENKQVVMARDNVDSIETSDQSLMPKFLLSDMTAQQAADLLTYLRSLGTTPASHDSR